MSGVYLSYLYTDTRFFFSFSSVNVSYNSDDHDVCLPQKNGTIGKLFIRHFLLPSHEQAIHMIIILFSVSY